MVWDRTGEAGVIARPAQAATIITTLSDEITFDITSFFAGQIGEMIIISRVSLSFSGSQKCGILPRDAPTIWWRSGHSIVLKTEALLPCGCGRNAFERQRKMGKNI
jgi:hypothetical protein